MTSFWAKLMVVLAGLRLANGWMAGFYISGPIPFMYRLGVACVCLLLILGIAAYHICFFPVVRREIFITSW